MCEKNEWICQLPHFRYRYISTELTPKELETFAIFACTGTIQVSAAPDEPAKEEVDILSELLPSFDLPKFKKPPIDQSTVDAFASLGVDLKDIKWNSTTIIQVRVRCRSYLLLIPLLYSICYTPTATFCYRYNQNCYYERCY